MTFTTLSMAITIVRSYPAPFYLLADSGATRDKAVSFRLEPRASRTATFILSWYFPNLERFGHRGNRYADWFDSSRDVALTWG